MSKNDHYLQFPLCALSFGKTERERLNAILDYAVVEAGAKLWDKAPKAVQNGFLARSQQARRLQAGFKRRHPLHLAALYGAEVLSVKYRDYQDPLEGHQRLRQYIAEFEAHHGRDALVRIKAEWLFKVRDHRGITCREFAVLCAIYSAIGDKQCARVTQPRISRCSLGYRKVAIMESEIVSRADGASPLTERELRDTIERLHRNNFFARRTAFRRFTYYSIRLDNEQLGKLVVERHSYPRFHRALQAAQDEAVTDAIKRRRAENGKNPST